MGAHLLYEPPGLRQNRGHLLLNSGRGRLSLRLNRLGLILGLVDDLSCAFSCGGDGLRNLLLRLTDAVTCLLDFRAKPELLVVNLVKQSGDHLLQSFNASGRAILDLFA